MNAFNTMPLDIETIPGQAAWILEELEEKHLGGAKAASEAKLAELDEIRAPLNVKDPAKIEAWERDVRPVKVAGIKVEAAALLAAGSAKVEDEWRRTSFDGALCQIVVIGYAFNDGKPFTIFEPDPKKCLTLASEAKLLRAFFKAMDAVPESQRHALQVVGHNVNDFDLRIIWQRAVIHGIKVPYWLPWDSKPWGDRVFDTMHRWAGAKSRISLDKLCRVLGIAGKGSEIGDEIDGSKVWDFVLAGRIADVATYCGGDVERAREIYQRLAFVDVQQPQKAAA